MEAAELARWEAFDPGLRMWTWMRDLPQQLERSARTWPDLRACDGPPRGIAVAAMGGSAMAAQVALEATNPPIPWAVVRRGQLPPWIGSDWVLVACSYSGNTQETIGCFLEAQHRGCRLCTISAGGVLADLAARHGATHRQLQPHQPPRTALGQLVAGVLWALWTVGAVPDPRDEIASACAVLTQCWGMGLGSPDPWETVPGRIARAIASTFTLVAGAGLAVAAASRWSQQLNENAKLPCYVLEIPEALHNHVEGLEMAARLGAVLVLLQDRGLSPLEAAAVDFLASLYEGFGGCSRRVASLGEVPLARIMSLISLGDQVSYLACALRGKDPTPVEMIGQWKERAPGEHAAGADLTSR